MERLEIGKSLLLGNVVVLFSSRTIIKKNNKQNIFLFLFKISDLQRSKV
jgi:hypothetical protein